MENTGAKPKTALGTGAGAGAGYGRHSQVAQCSAVPALGSPQQHPDNSFVSGADGPVGRHKDTGSEHGTSLRPSPRMPERNRSNNNRISSHSSDGTSMVRRGSMPNSLARHRLPPIDHRQVGGLPNETRRNTPASLSSESNGPRYPRRENVDRTTNRYTQQYGRPALRHRNPHFPLQNPTNLQRDSGGVPQPASYSGNNSHLRGDLSAMDSDNVSASSPPAPALGTSIQQTGVDASLSSEEDEPPVTSQVTRPGTASSDAGFARQLLQEEMDAILRADEELARELHDDLNFLPVQPWFNPFVERDHGDLQESPPYLDSPTSPVQGPTATHRFLPHLSTEPRRRVTTRGQRASMRAQENSGAEGPPRMGAGPFASRIPFLLGFRARGRRNTEPASSTSPQEDTESSESFFPDSETENFFEYMRDPSLMLLMLMLRSHETYEGGVDLNDYEGLWELAEQLGEVKKRGLSEENIKHIPTREFKGVTSKNGEMGAMAQSFVADQCQICLVDFEEGDTMRSIPCQHDFHTGCIDEWLKRNATCPICRHEIKPTRS